jgi:molybdate transport system ATP-binding protein
VTLAIDIAVRLPCFTLALRWSTAQPFLGIFGPSGAGKTTILETLAGLRRDATGTIACDGKTWLDTGAGVRLPPEERGIGYVPQDLLLFPHRSVLANVMAGRRRAERSANGAPDPRRVLEVLELTGLGDRSVSALSGGEKQRVALGRALCSGPGLLLLDEPVAGLDRPLKRRVLEYLLRAREEFAIPTMCVSHEITDMRLLCEEVAVLADGRARSVGPPEEVFAAPSIHAVEQGGVENVLSGRVVEAAGDTALVAAAPGLDLRVPAEGLRAGHRVWVGIGPEDLILALAPPERISARNVLRARVLEVREEPGGGPVAVLLDAGARQPLMAFVTRDARDGLSLAAGAAVHLLAKVSSFRVIAALPSGEEPARSRLPEAGAGRILPLQDKP